MPRRRWLVTPARIGVPLLVVSVSMVVVVVPCSRTLLSRPQACWPRLPSSCHRSSTRSSGRDSSNDRRDGAWLWPGRGGRGCLEVHAAPAAAAGTGSGVWTLCAAAATATTSLALLLLLPESFE
jgi:DNA-binding transcriptional LysR family regulator